MNYTPLKIYRFLPLVMFILCLIFGIYIMGGNSPDNYIAGHLVTFLGAVCFAIFCVASVVTSQIIYGGKKFDNLFYPVMGFLIAIITIIYSFFIISNGEFFHKVAGHNVLGLGLICLCIAIESAVCTRFVNISKNSNFNNATGGVNNFSKNLTRFFILVPLLAVITCWIWVYYLLMNSTVEDNFIPGHIMAGMAMICTCVLCVVVNSLKQINNTYQDFDKKIWPLFAFIMGLIALLWGISLLMVDKNQLIFLSPGFILTGISCVCFSIFSKLFLASRTWEVLDFPQANTVPFIPLFLFLTCLFLSIFIFQSETYVNGLFIPARVLVGLGSVCFSLYAVVSIISAVASQRRLNQQIV